MLRAILIFFWLLTSFFASFFPRAGFAEPLSELPQGDFGSLRDIGIAEVAAVIDPKTVQLVDGRVIRLSGLDFPDYNPDDPGPLSVTALEILQDMLNGQTVYVFQTVKKDVGRTNQMGHHLAHLQRQSDQTWVQGALLSLGLARAKTTQRNPEMAQQMFALEQQARESKIGIWTQDAGYPILTPEQAGDHLQSFQIVEGKIHSVSIRQNRIYINFGADWRSDFTVSIAPAGRRLFSKAGMDPLQWNGWTVRVRGWVESYNGPYIEIDHPQTLEIIDQAVPAQIPENQSAQPLPEPSEAPIVKTIQNIP
jgi:endonuclease YncB( thermonuclease family)